MLTWFAPRGTTTTELNAAYKDAGPLSLAPPAAAPSPSVTAGDWPSYNRTLTSERYSPLNQINTTNVGRLKVLCTYDVGQFAAFESGLIMVDNALIGTTEFDIFSLNPATCAENWRTREVYPPSLLPANRGAAYMDGMLFRGTQDGRVLAYDFKTGKRMWETAIADAKRGESVPSAPIAWDGLVFVGNAGGDFKGGKGRMYALDAKTGKIVWEFFLVPKAEGETTRGPQGSTPLDLSTWKNASGIPISGGGTWTSYTLDPKTGRLYVPGGNPAPDFAIGAREGDNLFTDSVIVLDAKTGDYKHHFRIVPKDWHDWDVSNPPVLIETRGGKQLMSVAPKDGHLYGFDLASNDLLYRVPVTTVENVAATFSPGQAVHFCPGSVGGAEWNSPAYDPQTNLILVGEVDWCDTVTPKDVDELRAVKVGQPWTGMATWNPFWMFGRMGGDGRTLGRVGLRRRRRHRRLEVAFEVQLPDRRRHDFDRRRRRVLRRHRRQLLRARRCQRTEALGPGSRRRDRRRCDHLCGERCAKSRRCGRLYAHRLADEDRDRQGRRAGPRQRLRRPVRSPPVTTRQRRA